MEIANIETIKLLMLQSNSDSLGSLKSTEPILRHSEERSKRRILMKYKTTLNPDSDFVKTMRQKIQSNSGYCPCK